MPVYETVCTSYHMGRTNWSKCPTELVGREYETWWHGSVGRAKQSYCCTEESAKSLGFKASRNRLPGQKPKSSVGVLASS